MAPRRDDAHGPGNGRLKPAPVHRTKSELARQHIQEMILSGSVRAGDRITSREVSEALRMSETPIREAIRGLSSEGWLEFNAHIGVVVASIQSGQLQEVYALRGALEALGIELGGASYTKEMLARLDENLAEAEHAVAEADIPAYAWLNREFHTLLCDTPHTQWTLRLLNNLWAQTSAMHRGFEAVPPRIRFSLAEHRAIRQAIAQGDLARAARLLVEHERLAGAALIEALGGSGRNLDPA
jgi:DNA-binding GntR family transcriptional regulator